MTKYCAKCGKSLGEITKSRLLKSIVMLCSNCYNPTNFSNDEWHLNLKKMFNI